MDNFVDLLIVRLEQIKVMFGNLKIFINIPEIGDVPLTDVDIEESMTPSGIKYVRFSYVDKGVGK